MNSLAGALPYNDAWENASAGELTEDDGGSNVSNEEKVRRMLEQVLALFDIRAMIALKESRENAFLFYVQTDDDAGADKVRDLKANLELALAVEPITFADFADKPSAICIIVPK